MPALTVFANPARKTAKRKKKSAPRTRAVHKNPGEATADAILSNRVIEIRYRHAEDGKLYKHTFKPGVRLVLMSDGTIRVVGARGQRLWGDF